LFRDPNTIFFSIDNNSSQLPFSTLSLFILLILNFHSHEIARVMFLGFCFFIPFDFLKGILLSDYKAAFESGFELEFKVMLVKLDFKLGVVCKLCHALGGGVKILLWGLS